MKVFALPIQGARMNLLNELSALGVMPIVLMMVCGFAICVWNLVDLVVNGETLSKSDKRDLYVWIVFGCVWMAFGTAVLLFGGPTKMQRA